MKNYNEMDGYEKSIAKELYSQFSNHYSKEKAQKYLEDYYDVMEKIGWHWSPKEWAERLHKQIQKKKSPEEWMEDIIEIERMPNRPGDKPKPLSSQRRITEDIVPPILKNVDRDSYVVVEVPKDFQVAIPYYSKQAYRPFSEKSLPVNILRSKNQIDSIENILANFTVNKE